MTDPRDLPSGFPGLVEILARLRAPDGCPWDREQTHESLVPYLLEEASEVAEAVRQGDPHHLADELGDVLLQVVFHAQIGAEAGRFTIDDVVRAISAKMVRRHPHVFGTATAATPEAVSAQWDAIKAQERGAAGAPASVLDRVGRGLGPLRRAQAVLRRAAAAGFDWPSPAGALAQVAEELAEVEAEVAGDPAALREEYGDLLVAVVALGRRLGLDAEQELIHGTAKFEARFRRLEAHYGGAEALAAAGPEALARAWKTLPEVRNPGQDDSAPRG